MGTHETRLFPRSHLSFCISPLLSHEFSSLRPALLFSGILGTFAVPVLFYTYSGILGRNVAWIDILIFFICVFVTFFSAWKLQNSVKIYQKRAAIIWRLFSSLYFSFCLLFSLRTSGYSPNHKNIPQLSLSSCLLIQASKDTTFSLSRARSVLSGWDAALSKFSIIILIFSS